MYHPTVRKGQRIRRASPIQKSIKSRTKCIKIHCRLGELNLIKEIIMPMINWTEREKICLQSQTMWDCNQPAQLQGLAGRLIYCSKFTQQASYLRPLSARQRNAIRMAFRWHADSGQFNVLTGYQLYLQGWNFILAPPPCTNLQKERHWQRRHGQKVLQTFSADDISRQKVNV